MSYEEGMTRVKWIMAVVYALTAVLLLFGCRSSRIDPEQQPWPVAPVAAGPGVPADIAQVPTSAKMPAGNIAQLAPPAPDAPRWQHRQYRRNVKAAKPSVPFIQGRAAVNAPAATQVAASYKPRAAVVVAQDSARVQVAQAGKNGQAAAGEGIVQEKVEPPKPTFWQRVTGLFTGLTSTVGWIALAVVALHAFGPGIGYGVGWARRRMFA